MHGYDMMRVLHYREITIECRLLCAGVDAARRCIKGVFSDVSLLRLPALMFTSRLFVVVAVTTAARRRHYIRARGVVWRCQS